ncbi:MAG: tetratricopeptide repeat protein [Crocinitomicaceae bacterium]|nr:tetratricopeptide repeat protein [Crocinitomicaceae bacterium]
MNTSLRNIGLSLGVIALTSVAFAQKKNETSAAVEYKNKYLPAIAKGDFETAKKALISAKEFVDLAATHEDTKDNQKTNWLKGEIYAAFLTVGMQSQDTSFLKLAGEDAIDQSISAYKHGYGLGKKMKSDFETSVYQKASMLNGMAGMLYKADQYKEAAELYAYQAKYSDAINELDSSAIYNASLCYEKAEDFEKAAQGYEKLSQVGYRGTTCSILASGAYRKAGNLDKAKAIIAEARKSNPSNRDLLLELVNTNIESGDAAGAQAALNDAIATDPENKQLHYTIGTIYIELKENAKAEEALNKALSLDSEYADAQYQLGAHLVTWAGDIKTEANQLKFGDPNYNKMLQQSEETYKRALIPLEAYIKNYPNDKAVLTILFQINRNLGNSEKALEYKKRADAL